MATELLNENTAVDATDAEGIVAQVRTLIEQDNIFEARRLLAAACQRDVSSSQLERWQRVLALPKAKSLGHATGSTLSTTTAWLKKHSSEYQGQWVALVDGNLLGAHVSRPQLQQSLQQSGQLQGAVFIRL